MIETHLRRCSNEKAKLVSSPSRIRNEQWKEAYRERKHRDKEEKSLQLFLSASTENPVKKGGNGDLSTGGGETALGSRIQENWSRRGGAQLLGLSHVTFKLHYSICFLLSLFQCSMHCFILRRKKMLYCFILRKKWGLIGIGCHVKFIVLNCYNASGMIGQVRLGHR